MKCRRARRRLSARLDEELSPAEQTELTNHLRTCRECAREWEELTQIWELAGMLPQMNHDPNFDAALWARIQEQEARAARKPSRRPLIPRLAWTIAAGLSVAATAWFGVALGGLLSGVAAGGPKARAETMQEAVLDSLHVATFRDLPPDSVGGAYLRLASTGGVAQGRRNRR